LTRVSRDTELDRLEPFFWGQIQIKRRKFVLVSAAVDDRLPFDVISVSVSALACTFHGPGDATVSFTLDPASHQPSLGLMIDIHSGRSFRGSEWSGQFKVNIEPTNSCPAFQFAGEMLFSLVLLAALSTRRWPFLSYFASCLLSVCLFMW
jgi:hypothetical protein